MINLRAIPFFWPLFSLLASASFTKPITCNITSIAQNATILESCKVLCKPAKWTNFLIFYAGNYLTHVATLRSVPGQGTREGIVMMIYALIFPTIGLVTAVKAITSLAIFEKSPLRAAAKTEAFYMVIKYDNGGLSGGLHEANTETQKRNDAGSETQKHNETEAERKCRSQGDRIQSLANGLLDPGVTFDTLNNQSSRDNGHSDLLITLPSIEQKTTKEEQQTPLRESCLYFVKEGLFKRKIHGRVSLPSGWILIKVPVGATFADDKDIGLSTSLGWSLQTNPSLSTNLAQDYSFFKALIAVVQTLFAIYTLYNTSLHEVEQFGYAAAGFTVVPFAFMSFIHFLANIACPTFPAMYIVENDVLQALRRRIASENKQMTFYVEGTVGTLEESYREEYDQEKARLARDNRLLSEMFLYILLVCLLIGAVLGLMGGFTGFSKAHSILAQRVWIMLWLSVGICSGAAFGVSLFWAETYQTQSWADDWEERKSTDKGLMILVMLLAPIAIGAYIVVGKMIKQSGACEHI